MNLNETPNQQQDGQKTCHFSSEFLKDVFLDLPILAQHPTTLVGLSGSETESESDNEVGLALAWGGIEDTCTQVDSFIDHES